MVCVYCLDEVPDIEGAAKFIPIHYTISGDEELGLFVGVCSKTCGKESENPTKFTVMEAIISARIARARNPDKSYTPPRNYRNS